VTFDNFLNFLSEQPENVRYELHTGEIIKMPQPLGKHEKIIMFLARQLLLKVIKLERPYEISSKNVLVRLEDKLSGYYPDILLLNLPNLENEPLWEQESTVSLVESIPLVIEVVSTNWRDDYHKKLADYEEMGIPEYWVVDYMPFGSKMLIGESKQPTITIYSLSDEGAYCSKQFRGDDLLESPTFPDLNLTALAIFSARY
ncbi:MAG: Uma2 family endonuclease, partial [Nostocaceae cyanobacterium]|nr:Uma2 family endonuclease [Nostocaceae cyanobacterium]